MARNIFLLYHELRNERTPYTYALCARDFERHLQMFAAVRDRRASGEAIPQITFDDGFRSDYEQAAPALARYGQRAWFFITAGWTGKKTGYMEWDQVRALHAAGHVIGAHGWSHVLLTHCSPADLQSELLRPKQTLEDKLGAAVSTMSLPGGRYNARVLRACKQAGYSQVFTSSPQSVPDATEELIGRVNICGNVTDEWLAQLLGGEGTLLASLKRRERAKHILRSILGDRLYGRVWASANMAAQQAA